MKKLGWMMCVVMLLSLLGGCGVGAGNASSLQGGAAITLSNEELAAEYKRIVEEARNPELNELPMYEVVTGPEDMQYEFYFHESTGLKAEDMRAYAISVGTIITIAYGVGIVLPEEGKEQAVVDQLEAYILQQQQAQEFYLRDQYEIAKSAQVKVAPTGEVLFAMSEDAADVMQKMEEGLAALQR